MTVARRNAPRRKLVVLVRNASRPTFRFETDERRPSIRIVVYVLIIPGLGTTVNGYAGGEHTRTGELSTLNPTDIKRVLSLEPSGTTKTNLRSEKVLTVSALGLQRGIQ